MSDTIGNLFSFRRESMPASTRTVLLLSGAERAPYEATKLTRYGYDVVMPQRRATGLIRKARDVFEHRRGVLVEEALRGIGKSVDVVLCVFEQCTPVPLKLRQWGVPPYRATPVVTIACWLAETLRRLPRTVRLREAQRYLGTDLLLYFSANQRDVFEDCGFHPDQLGVVPFGVSLPVPKATHTSDRPRKRDIPILAVGSDRGRDYATLCAAVRSTDLRVELYCKASNLNGVDVPPNVRRHDPVDYRHYVGLLDRAAVVVVPTHELGYPTGQSVALEAAAHGACVVATGTTPLREYFTDGSTALFAEPSDPTSLREKIERALTSADLRLRIGSAAKESVNRQFTTDHMWRAVADHLDALLSHREGGTLHA